MDEITEMKVRMEEDIKVLVKSADSNADKAESEGKLPHFKVKLTEKSSKRERENFGREDEGTE